MASISRTTDLPGPISAAEDLWYDLRRRVSFVEGFGHVAQVDGDWPQLGARVQWDAPAKSERGRVAETVDAFEARSHQVLFYEDAVVRGTQTTTFAPNGDLVRITVKLDWALKAGNPLTDWLFVRRQVGEQLRKTLVKYRIERIADLEEERARGGTAP